MSPWSVGVPSVPAAAPTWPLVALDAFHPVADDTPPDLDDTLPGVAPVLNDTPRSTADIIPGVEPSLP